MKRNVHRRGFTVWEMMVVIILLGTVAVLMPRVFGSSLRIVRTAPLARDEMIRYESMLAAMRQDVWSAAALHGGAGELQIESLAPCRWTIDHSKIERTGEGVTRRWEFANVRQMSFELTETAVVLHIESSDGATDSMRFASEVLRLNQPETRP